MKAKRGGPEHAAQPKRGTHLPLRVGGEHRRNVGRALALGHVKRRLAALVLDGGVRALCQQVVDDGHVRRRREVRADVQRGEPARGT